MGYWYSELIAPAVLFNNPDITAIEYGNLLDQTEEHYGYIPEHLYRLPETLSLPHTRQFNIFSQSTIDSQGLEIFPTILLPYKKPYQVIVHLSNTLLSPKKYRVIDCDNIISNTIIPIGIPYEERSCLVNEIIQRKERKLPNNNSPYYCLVDPKKQYYDFTVRGQELIREYQYQYFDNTDTLYQQWPQFIPENVYDFSRSCGHFPQSNIHTERFCWSMGNGRYSLDPITFDKIPAGGDVRSFGVGYTDLVITTEVIKNNEMFLLGHNSRDPGKETLLQDFLNRHQESKSRVDLAVWDAHTFIWAKQNQATYFDLFYLRAPHDSP